MKKTISIIGSGPSALVLAAQLNEQKFDVTVYERNFAPGRKFLVAGDGGFNLTHSENTDRFILRYTPASFFQNLISSFNNNDLCDWLKNIGIETYVGSSKRVFPVKGIKPIDVLNAILNELKRKNVLIKTQHLWKGWSDKNELLFENNKAEITVKSDFTVFALGGASWSKTGSDGSWTNIFEKNKIGIIPFQASNCAYKINWDDSFLASAEGKSLKNISISCNGKSKSGELVITRFGIEGGAIYALSPEIREQLKQQNTAAVYVDLKPVFPEEEIKNKLLSKGNRSVTKQLEDELNFNAVHIALLKSVLSKEEFTNSEALAKKIKNLPLMITAAAPIDEAISTVGGIPLTEIDEHFQLQKLPANYVIGEMLDWDAPTGGYLLQGCFSMGSKLAGFLNEI
ncbi:MAG: flavoprotein family/uncharacterized flavoprotein family [Bacteroidetes bacterium]|nr:flavoprotein family/uncharacterized flavoprotein family [Bacteroidota bacterium]